MSQFKDYLLISLIAILSIVTVVYAAPAANTAGVATVNATPSITGCQAGFRPPADVTSDACIACAAGTYTSAGNLATTCTPCEAGNYCPAPSVTTGTTTGATKTACTAGNYCPASAGTQTTCPVGNYCLAAAATPTPCTSGQAAPAGQDAASDCIAYTGTAITGCLVYGQDATTATCAIAKDGYFLGAAAPTSTVTACLTNCGKCTGATYALCTEAAAGYFKDATTSTVIACAAGCKVCTAAAATSCTTAMAGFYIDATAGVKACADGTGVAQGANAGATTCTACTGLCKNCQAPGFCTVCKPGNVLTADTGVCTAFAGTKDVTCLLAEGSTNADCNTCDAANFRKIEQQAGATAGTMVDKTKGKCLCMDGYAQANPVVAACKKCSDNVKTCTFSSTGVETVVDCLPTFFKAGNACVAKELTTVAGFFWNSVGSKYDACNASCKTCTAAGADKCVACPDRDAKWVEPTSSATNYNTYLQAITNINGTCYSECPAGQQADAERKACAAPGSASGLFGILAIILTFFLYI